MYILIKIPTSSLICKIKDMNVSELVRPSNIINFLVLSIDIIFWLSAEKQIVPIFAG
jgi:hypothetical protein